MWLRPRWRSPVSPTENRQIAPFFWAQIAWVEWPSCLIPEFRQPLLIPGEMFTDP